MLAAIILAAVIDICFILDTFVFVPKGVDKFSRSISLTVTRPAPLPRR